MKRIFNIMNIYINFSYICIINTYKQQTMTPRLPVHCPACQSKLDVTELSCAACHTRIAGRYALPALLQLGREEQEFVLQFFLSSGSLKEMADRLGKSYPTVRNKLDDIIDQIKTFEKEASDE